MQKNYAVLLRDAENGQGVFEGVDKVLVGGIFEVMSKKQVQLLEDDGTLERVFVDVLRAVEFGDGVREASQEACRHTDVQPAVLMRWVREDGVRVARLGDARERAREARLGVLLTKGDALVNRLLDEMSKVSALDWKPQQVKLLGDLLKAEHPVMRPGAAPAGGGGGPAPQMGQGDAEVAGLLEQARESKGRMVATVRVEEPQDAETGGRDGTDAGAHDTPADSSSAGEARPSSTDLAGVGSKPENQE